MDPTKAVLLDKQRVLKTVAVMAGALAVYLVDSMAFV